MSTPEIICRSCFQPLPDSQTSTASRPIWPCPYCGTRIDMRTGEIAPTLSEFKRSPMCCGDFLQWHFVDFCLAFSMFPELAATQKFPMLQAFSRLPEFAGFCTHALESTSASISTNVALSIINDESYLGRDLALISLYDAFRNEAMFLWHRCRSTSMAALGAYCTESAPINTDIYNEKRALSHIEIAGHSFAITGGLDQLRSFYVEAIENAGGIFHASVRHDTDILVLGEKPGQKKVDAAIKKGVRTCTLDTLKVALGLSTPATTPPIDETPQEWADELRK